jgi:hypothetical protein
MVDDFNFVDEPIAVGEFARVDNATAANWLGGESVDSLVLVHYDIASSQHALFKQCKFARQLSGVED